MVKKDLSVLSYMGARIKELRKANKIDQEDLAATLNLTRVSVLNIEKGRQSLTCSNLLKCCAIFNVSPNDLYPEVPVIKLVISPKTERKKRQIVAMKERIKKLESELLK